MNCTLIKIKQQFKIPRYLLYNHSYLKNKMNILLFKETLFSEQLFAVLLFLTGC